MIDWRIFLSLQILVMFVSLAAVLFGLCVTTMRIEHKLDRIEWRQDATLLKHRL